MIHDYCSIFVCCKFMILDIRFRFDIVRENSEFVFLLCKACFSDDFVFLQCTRTIYIMQVLGRYIQVYLLFFFLFLTGTLQAIPRYYFKQISLAEGLSQSSVKCVLVDDRGVLWIGTRFGLNRFDREKITVYQEEHDNPYSLPYNDVVFLEEDAERNIWVGTSRGLATFDRNSRKFDCQELDGEPIVATCCLLMPEGVYFFGAKGVYYYSYAEKKIGKCQLNDTMPVSVPNRAYLYDEKEEKIILSFRGDGIWWYYPKKGTMERVPFIRERNIPALFQDSLGRIWVSVYNKGVFCYDREGRLVEHLETPERLTHNVVQDMREKDGELWLATDGGGIDIYNYADRTVKGIMHLPGDRHSLPVNSFASLYIDDEGNIWAGSILGGLIGIKPVYMTTYRDAPPGATYGLSFQSVASMYEDHDGQIWMGTDGGGMDLFDPKSETFQEYRQTKDMKIVSIMPYNDSELLLSLFGVGIYRFNKKTGECREFSLNWGNVRQDLFLCGNSVRLRRMDDDHFCLLTDNYLFVYDHRKHQFESFSENMLPNFQAPRFVAGDSCYIGTSSGLYVLDFPGRELRPIFLPGDEIGTITAIKQGKDRRFWLGTTSGLYVYDRALQKLDTVETKRFIGVMSLAFDNRDQLWISTHEGLYAYVPKEKRIVVLGESDGVFTHEFLPQPALESVYGDIYMAGVEGVVRIRPDQKFQEEKDFSVSLVNLALDGSFIHQYGLFGEQEISVPWDYSSLGLSVIVKEKDLMRKKLFRFYIKGDRDDLLETSSHAFSFPALSPGNYELWVSYSKRNGDWSIPLKLLVVHVVPPLWRRAWFWAVLVLLMVTVAAWVVWAVMKRKERELAWTMKEHERKFYEEKVRFMVNISHELRTPLTLIYAPLKRLLKSGKVTDEEVSKQLDGLLLQTCRMREIVDMVLEAQRSNTNGDVMDIRFHNIADWIRTVTDDFAQEFEARGIQLEYKLDASVEKIPFDAAKCRVVLSNLLINAMKFSDPNTLLVICTERMGAFLRISLADQGIGLDHVDMDRLFSHFYQGDHNYKGSGIGLAYARKLVELHGGSIGACKNEDGGATFYFDLPLEQTVVSGEPDSDVSSAGGETGEANLPVIPADLSFVKYTALVVEDEPELRNYLFSVLQTEFKNVYVAGDGEEAWEFLKQSQPDIIISDVMMPRMDGYELCRRVKNDLKVSHIPVILLTAKADPASSVEGYKSGADIYLAKPFDMDSLMVILQNVLKQREQLRARYRESGCLFSPKEDAVSNADEQFMQKLNLLIHENLANPDLNVAFIASGMAMSRTTLYSKFSQLSDISIGDYVTRFRMVEATRLLSSHKEMSIQDVADRTGFSSARYFSTVFKQNYGMTPTEYRRNNQA